MGLFNRLFKSSIDEDRDVFMAGYRAGFPAESDGQDLSVDRSNHVYQRGLEHGQRDCARSQRELPHLFKDGKLIDDAGEE